MLRSLHIENYAIIEKLDIEFGSGLNIITGQTGAGKSILLGALGLLGGQRVESTVIGSGSQRCIVEGVFEVGRYGIEDVFAELELDWAEEITIRRVVSQGGKSRAFIDDVPVTLSTLKTVSDALVDIHSQHKTLLLARGDFQKEILDAVAGSGEDLEEYAGVYGRLKALRKEIKELHESQSKVVANSDYVAYQIEQLQVAGIKYGEQQELEQEQVSLTHAEEIGMAYNTAHSMVDDEENGVLSTLRRARDVISRIEGKHNRAKELADRIESSYIELKDIGEELSDLAESIESDPRRLEVVNERLDTIYTLCRKYGVDSGDELGGVLQRFEAEFNAIEGGSELLERKEKEERELSATAQEVAGRLTKNRRGVVGEVREYVENQLRSLGMSSPRLEIEVVEVEELGISGGDRVDFLFSANENSEPVALGKVASGGEMSRLMLSIKNLVAERIELPTVIFDEIDSGVSGAVADAMGAIIEQMSRSMQVINITHLPQVAAKGSDHFEVYKDNGTHIRKLNHSERVEHIAAMLSGATITKAAVEQAKELLQTIKKR